MMETSGVNGTRLYYRGSTERQQNQRWYQTTHNGGFYYYTFEGGITQSSLLSLVHFQT